MPRGKILEPCQEDNLSEVNIGLAPARKRKPILIRAKTGENLELCQEDNLSEVNIGLAPARMTNFTRREKPPMKNYLLDGRNRPEKNDQN
jgi:hypothetical protein